MAREIFTIAYNGEELDIEADSPEQALALVQGQPEAKAPAPEPMDPMAGEGMAQASAASQMLPMLKTAAERMTPLGSVNEIAGQLTGDRPSSALKAGLAGADLASLGAFTKGKGAAQIGKGLLESLGIGAASGAGAMTAEAMGAPAPIAGLIGLGAGVGAGRAISPEMAMKAVPQGQEPRAVAALASKMGLGVQAPAGAKPRDIIGAFQTAKGQAGEAVGAAKEAAMQTGRSAEEVLEAIRQNTKTGLVKAGVPVVEGSLSPTLAKEGAAPAELVIERLGALSAIPEGASGPEAMKLANNVLEGLKKTVAESARAGTGQAGRTSKMAMKEWQGAIDALGPADKVAAAKVADRAFSKLASLTEMAEKSSKTMTGIQPGFSPRKFVYMWETMPEAKRRAFNADEIAMLDAMLTQKPGYIQKGIQYAVDFAKTKGIKGLSFHPTARFYEEGARAVGPRAAGVAATAQGRQESERPKTFYQSLQR